MAVLRFLWRIVSARALWIFLGVLLLCLLIWVFGHIVSIGSFVPLGSDTAKLVAIGIVVFVYLLLTVLAWRRRRKAEAAFVAELSEPAAPPAPTADQAAVAAVTERFDRVIAEVKRTRRGERRLLREMPWYVIIGPPGTGKTTALQQSDLGLLSLDGELQGIGGTRHCDWFFSTEAVLIDTAGRYTTQDSDPVVDAAEWSGFLDLLRKHRGRRALNGVIVTLSCEELAAGEAAVRHHGNEIRKRLAEIEDRLELKLPVYLMLSKADLLPGFVPFFDALTTEEREQVWGTTFAPGDRPGPAEVGDGLAHLARQLEDRLVTRLDASERPEERAAIFRFPTQVQALAGPVAQLVATVFGQSRNLIAGTPDGSPPWLRGLYLTSATQEGSPVDRLVAGLAGRFGVSAAPMPPAGRAEKRSFFLTGLFRDLIFREAGLGVFDAKKAEIRRWTWRLALTGAAAVVVLSAFSFTLSHVRTRRAMDEQTARFVDLARDLTPIANRQVPVSRPEELYDALGAIQAVADTPPVPVRTVLTPVGPSAAADIAHAQETAYHHALRTLLEPRMVAFLEEVMWRRIRDPEFLLDALKVYLMMTGESPFDRAFVGAWWEGALPGAATINPFRSEAAYAHQMAAFDRLAFDDDKIAPDATLIEEARESIRSVPLAIRAYRALMADPAITGQADWVPADHAGPRGTQVLTRRSGKSLRLPIDGAFTYRGFRDGVLARIDEVAGEVALDRWVYEGGAVGEGQTATPQLIADILKLYYDDYIATWDSFLSDVTLAPLNSLQVAAANLKDLSGPDSALERLLTAVARETELTRAPPEGDDGGRKVPKGAYKLLGPAAKYVKKGVKLFGSGGDDEEEVDRSGQPVADHFIDIKAAVEEVDGAPPALDAAVAALGALAGELQTIAASPDPEEALVARGGISALAQSVANEAARLPEPLDTWLAGAAEDTTSFSANAIRAELNAVLRADILPFCRAATAGRYPFVRTSPIDVNIADFRRLFEPGGLFDSFVTQKLEPLIDTAARPWRWRPSVNFSTEALRAFEQSRAIRDGLFAGGSAGFSFKLEPVDLSPSASRVRLDLDGQVIEFYNNPTQPVPIQWPGPGGNDTIRLTFTPADGSPDALRREVGPWSLLRLIRSGDFRRADLPELYRLQLSEGGHTATFELRAESVVNPFDLRMFAAFTCPGRI